MNGMGYFWKIFQCVGERNASLIEKLIHLWVRFHVEVFSFYTSTETCAILFQNWFDHDWIDFGVFLIDCSSFVNLKSAWR